MIPDDQAKKISQVIARCWSDDAFKKKVLSDPKSTLISEGIEIPTATEVRAVEQTSNLIYLVIPPKPAELSDEDLETAAGGIAGKCEQCAGKCELCVPPPCAWCMIDRPGSKA